MKRRKGAAMLPRRSRRSRFIPVHAATGSRAATPMAPQTTRGVPEASVPGVTLDSFIQSPLLARGGRGKRVRACLSRTNIDTQPNSLGGRFRTCLRPAKAIITSQPAGSRGRLLDTTRTTWHAIRRSAHLARAHDMEASACPCARRLLVMGTTGTSGKAVCGDWPVR